MVQHRLHPNNNPPLSWDGDCQWIYQIFDSILVTNHKNKSFLFPIKANIETQNDNSTLDINGGFINFQEYKKINI